MKKLISILTLLVAVTFVFTGCGSKAASNAPQNSNGMQRNGWGNPSDRADAIGEVDTISGNNITLKLIAMPTRQGNNISKGQNSQGAPRRDRSQGNGYGNRQPQYTGETQTITVSDTTPISTFSRDENGGMKTENIKIADIKKGDRLQVWYLDKDKKTIKKLSVMSQRSEPSNNN